MVRTTATLVFVFSLMFYAVPPALAQEPLELSKPASAKLEQPEGALYFPMVLGEFDGNDTELAEEDHSPAQTNTNFVLTASDETALLPEIRDLPSHLLDYKLSTRLESNKALTVLYSATQAELGVADPLAQAGQVPSVATEALVRLTAPAWAEVVAAGAMASGDDVRSNTLAAVEAQQAEVINLAHTLDPASTVLAQTKVTLNALALRLDAAALAQLARHPYVRSVAPIVNYPYANLDPAQVAQPGEATLGEIALADNSVIDSARATGYTGAGIDVAVIDSGIDYTHMNFGGTGTRQAYELAYGVTPTDTRNTTVDGLFPTVKVVGGYDFVGESWPSGALKPDPDPIDYDGHGTHVADIIAGARGMAPGARLFAIKACSAVAHICSGTAVLQSLEYAADPNGDGDPGDAVDIVNLSFGSTYGQAYDSDHAQAVENISKLGVLVAAAAGNSGDRPYSVSAPAVAPSALAVALTHLPSARAPLLRVVEPVSLQGVYRVALQAWSPSYAKTISGEVVYGLEGNLDGCRAFAPGALVGKILLVERGQCNISLKAANGAVAGALAVLIGLTSPGEPFQFGYGGDAVNVPVFVIRQAESQLLKSALSTRVWLEFDPANTVSLAGQAANSSARGPSLDASQIKPEIAAPGEIVSAIAGSGQQIGPFGGTSGATPVVAGGAALLRQAAPSLSPKEIKALLMNTAENKAPAGPATLAALPASITRVGSGELRIERALRTFAAAWDLETGIAALSFGFREASEYEYVARRMINLHNYSDQPIRFAVQSHFRDPADAANAALEWFTPALVEVEAGGDVQFVVEMRLLSDRLPLDWLFNSGDQGANGQLFSEVEYDGYLVLTEAGNPANRLQLPWHVLPRRAGDVTLKGKEHYVAIRNRGAGRTKIDAYSLIATSANRPAGALGANNPTPDLRYVGYATYLAPAGVCSAQPSFVLAFAINTWERQTLAAAPASIEIDIDTNRDNRYDYLIFTWDASLAGAHDFSDGRNLTWVYNVATRKATAAFFTDHESNSANTVMFICGEQIGMNLANVDAAMNLIIYANDNYFSAYMPGAVTDVIYGVTIAPLGERYLGLFEPPADATGNSLPFAASVELASKQNSKLYIQDLGVRTNNSEKGLLLFYRHGAIEGQEAGVIEITGGG